MSQAPIRFYVDLLLASIAVLPLFYAVPSLHFRRLLLAALGLYLTFLAAPHLILFWIPYWFAIWIANAVLDKTSENRNGTLVFWVMLAAAIAPMLYWKLFDAYFLQQLNAPLRAVFERYFPAPEGNDAVLNLAVPLGLSFSTFRAIDFLICRFLGLVSRQSLGSVFYLGFFPSVLLLGPIAQSSEMLESAGKPVQPTPDTRANLVSGAARIIVGLIKVYVLSQPLLASSKVVEEYASHSPGWLWLNVIANAWYFYLNFAGFSDIAIGSARLYGFRLNENFNFPYFRPNLLQFWANWHMSLTGFAQRNVFVPLGGFRKQRQYLATVATMMVIALWHDISPALVVFGAIHSVVLVALRLGESRVKRGLWWPRLPAVPATLLTFLFVAVTIPLVSVPDIDVLDYIRHLFFRGDAQ